MADVIVAISLCIIYGAIKLIGVIRNTTNVKPKPLNISKLEREQKAREWAVAWALEASKERLARTQRIVNMNNK